MKGISISTQTQALRVRRRRGVAWRGSDSSRDMRAQNIGSVRAGVSRAVHDIMDLRESLVLESAMLMRSIFQAKSGFGFGFGCMEETCSS